VAKNLFSGTLLTKIVVVVTGTREDAASDGSNASSTTGARISASEVRVDESVAAEGAGEAGGSRMGIIQTRAALSLRLPTVYERP